MDNGGEITTFVYNGKGQRIKKTGSSGTFIYHYDLRGNLIEETDQNGNLIADYVYVGTERVAMIKPDSTIYYYHNDHLGTPLAMTNQSGQTIWAAYYRPFGEAVIEAGATVTNNFRFPGQYYDQETGLHYNYHRYYDPATGRYLSPDPILSNFYFKNKFYFVAPIFKTSPMRLVPYVYVRNNPLFGIDPEGTDEPGCDRVPDILETKCIRKCCDDHDLCYKALQCTEKSWTPGYEKRCGEDPYCKYCNLNVAICITKCFLTLQGPGQPFGGPSVTE